MWNQNIIAFNKLFIKLGCDEMESNSTVSALLTQRPSITHLTILREMSQMSLNTFLMLNLTLIPLAVYGNTFYTRPSL